jgi:trans-aconitate 2-methyltransferase
MKRQIEDWGEYYYRLSSPDIWVESHLLRREHHPTLIAIMSDWSPEQYLKFADERTRPARDLLAQIPLKQPSHVYDLGCGPGNSTELLVKAYPNAKIIGIDSSPAMIAKARTAVPAAEFHLADLADWQPVPSADLLFSNATFQWLPQHLSLLQAYLRHMKQGAVLAVQMPDNLGEPSHAIMRDVAGADPWAAKLKAADVTRSALVSPTEFYAALKPFCQKLDIWHCIYNHPLSGAEAIVDWLKSTGLKPYLDALTTDEQALFLADYHQRIVKAYPADAAGISLLRFPRLFIVAVK